MLPLTGTPTASALRPRPRKHGLELSVRDDDSLWREPRWNADRCAHPEGCAAVPAARQVGLASVVVPLPFSFVAWLRRGERSGQQKAGTTPSFSSAISFALQSWRHLQNL